jgi:hypothetical protein
LEEVSSLEEQNSGFIRKFVIIICIVGFFFFGYFMIFLPIMEQGSADRYFAFSEVPADQIGNRTVIHLEDKDILNVRGLDVKFRNGKISRIYFRGSQNPEIESTDFNLKYGSTPEDPSSRKYLEYKGVYYIAIMYTP